MSSVVSRQHSKKLASLHEELRSFCAFGKMTSVSSISQGGRREVPVYVNEFWTSKQRAANRLHEVSYRACFRPQLPRFFIERLTTFRDIVFDPFMGRGTTLLEAALLDRIPAGCDANPLCEKLIVPRLRPPTISLVEERLKAIPFDSGEKGREDLLVFYHPRTLRQLHALKSCLQARRAARKFDAVDAWIQMVAINRLTGHSKGFFSVYTLPPNQAVSLESQRKINQRLKQRPEFRSVPDLILAKTKSLLSEMTPERREALWAASREARVMTTRSESVPALTNGSVDLVVTSPPFLKVVDYAADNWLRCWFSGIESSASPFEVHAKLSDWKNSMTSTLKEVHRVLKPGGWVAFEVGEIHNGKVRLEESVIPAGVEAGLCPALVLVNSQQFTKTANCWGVRNNDLGTNTNRIVLFHKRS